jgi:putative glycerol-1-phosphate prenyltransferase
VKKGFYQEVIKNKHRKTQVAVLIDPDKYNPKVISNADKAGADVYFVGGSLLSKGEMDKTIKSIRKISTKPIIIFPGDPSQSSRLADGILFLSLLSGRNADLIIGQQVKASMALKKSGLEIISTAYLIIDGGKITSAMYMSGTLPIPSDKIEIAVSTALAAEMMGFKFIYLEAGSGADKEVPKNMIQAIRKNVSIPILVGGGIDNHTKAKEAAKAGADMLIIGNALEKNPDLIFKICSAVKK